MFIDAEHALDSTYARAVGVDMSKLYLAQPDNGEQGVFTNKVNQGFEVSGSTG